MNNTVLTLKEMKRAMQPFVLFLYELVYEGKMNNVLEIGVRQAQSTRTILSALNELGRGNLVSIDLGDRLDRIPEELRPYWTQIIGNSHSQDIHDLVPQKEYDLLLIDGDHSYDGVRRDYRTYQHFVKKGGYILFHDTINKDCGVPKFWEELKAEYKNAGMFDLPHGIAGMGVMQIL